MISVYDVLIWIKRASVYHELFRHGYCGKLDNKPDQALGVYPLKGNGQPYRAYGGLESYEIIGISLLIHYNHNVEQSQKAACKLFEYLRTPFPSEEMMTITEGETERRIKYINLNVPEPVFVGTDDYGVYEFVIEFELYVEKESENYA